VNAQNTRRSSVEADQEMSEDFTVPELIVNSSSTAGLIQNG
jgi:hypothetical protein